MKWFWYVLVAVASVAAGACVAAVSGAAVAPAVAESHLGMCLAPQAGVDRSVIHSVKLLSQRPGRAGIGAILHIARKPSGSQWYRKL